MKTVESDESRVLHYHGSHIARGGGIHSCAANYGNSPGVSAAYRGDGTFFRNDLLVGAPKREQGEIQPGVVGEELGWGATEKAAARGCLTPKW